MSAAGLDAELASRPMGDSRPKRALELRTSDLADGCARMWAEGVREARLAGPVDLSADSPGQTLRLLRFLRDAGSYGMTVSWHATHAATGLDERLFHHLPPPEPPALPDWRSSYRYGLCHYRRGPGFLAVADARFGAPTRFLIDGPELELLLRYEEAADAAPTGPSLQRLLDRRLILCLGGTALTLPYRLRRWPIPCTSL